MLLKVLVNYSDSLSVLMCPLCCLLADCCTTLVRWCHLSMLQ